MSNQVIPQTPFAIIRGSGTWGVGDLALESGEEGVVLVQDDLFFETPHGPTGKFQLYRFAGDVTADGKERDVLVAVSHGWHPDMAFDPRASLPVFWVFQQAGVRKIVVEVTAGSLSRFLMPRDLVIPTDVIDNLHLGVTLLPNRFQQLNRGVQLLCPHLSLALEEASQGLGFGRIYGHDIGAVMGTTLGPRFETPAEARALMIQGCDLVGQSIVPEVNLAADIRACYAHADLITDWVDGVMPQEKPWELDGIHVELKTAMATLVLRALKSIRLSDECGCMNYRRRRPALYREGF